LLEIALDQAAKRRPKESPAEHPELRLLFCQAQALLHRGGIVTEKGVAFAGYLARN
jgi:hypothetical protein